MCWTVARANAKNQARKGTESEGRGSFQEPGQEGVSEKVTSELGCKGNEAALQMLPHLSFNTCGR